MRAFGNIDTNPDNLLFIALVRFVLFRFDSIMRRTLRLIPSDNIWCQSLVITNLWLSPFADQHDVRQVTTKV